MTAYTVIETDSPECDRFLGDAVRVCRLADPATSDGVRDLFADVAERGAAAVVDASTRYDGMAPDAPVLVDRAVLERQAVAADDRLRESLRAAFDAQYEVAVRSLAPDVAVDVRDGVVTRLVHRPMRSVALYVPGGRQRYPSTLVGLLASARAAQVGQIAIVLPPSADGLPDPVSAWVALQYDGTPVLCGNGPAIIAGLALRISGFPAVDMIVGPGGPAVVAAQHLAAEHGVSTGPQFGPTDCTILAGPDADPGLLVADLLTESEHGHTPRLVLIGWGAIEQKFFAALAQDPEGARIWARTGLVIRCPDQQSAMRVANKLGGEQIQLAVPAAQARALLPSVDGYASVLIGQGTGISAAYMTGAPGCLPTGAAARAVSVVTAQTFRRTMVVGEVHARAQADLAALIDPLAKYEGFPRHGGSQHIRA